MIFSDKTGTLTKNKMVFKKCSINGSCYGELEANEVDDNSDGMCFSGIKKLKSILNEEEKKRSKKNKA